jgi:hypothetical protein
LVAIYHEWGNKYKILSALKIDGKSPLLKPRFKWEDNTKTDLQQKKMGADGKGPFWVPK